jgi:hypothetical protein
MSIQRAGVKNLAASFPSITMLPKSNCPGIDSIGTHFVHSPRILAEPANPASVHAVTKIVRVCLQHEAAILLSAALLQGRMRADESSLLISFVDSALHSFDFLSPHPGAAP